MSPAPDDNPTAAPQAAPLPLARRVARYVAVGAWITVLGAVGYLAVTRWNGVPADPGGATVGATFTAPPLDPALDRTEELTEILHNLPDPPDVTLPEPPEGMRWKVDGRLFLDVGDVVYGEWTPDTRPNLQAVVRYLESDEVSAILERIAAMKPGGWRPVAGFRAILEIRNLARLLDARARYRHAGSGDVDGAVTDLLALNTLAKIVSDSGDELGMLIALGCYSIADRELVNMARELPVSLQAADRLLERMTNVPVSRAVIWDRLTTFRVGSLRIMLDRSFTDDGHGNGWLVLARLGDLGGIWAPEPRVGAWNMLSPVFNDRRTVNAKIEYLDQFLRAVEPMNYLEAREHLESEQPRLRFNLADGPLVVQGRSSSALHMLRLSLQTVADRRAALTAVALSAYRHREGRYPDTLQQAIAPFGDEIAEDPFGTGLLYYRCLDEGQDYLLYSLGPDGDDDGGSEIDRDWADGDRVFTRGRRKPYAEPELVPAE